MASIKIELIKADSSSLGENNMKTSIIPREESLLDGPSLGTYAWSHSENVGIVVGNETQYYKVYYNATFTYSQDPTYSTIKRISSITNINSSAPAQGFSTSTLSGSWKYTFTYSPQGSVGAITGNEQIGALSFNGTGAVESTFSFMGYSTTGTSTKSLPYNTQVYSSTFPNIRPL